jgi:carbamoyltransferase
MLDEHGHIRMGRQYRDAFIGMFGQPRRRDEEISQRDKDIARSCQLRFEDAAVHCLRRLHRLVPTKQLAMAGGCALNGVANARILRDTHFTQPYLQAAASDEGTSLGAAYWCYHNVAAGKERYHMSHAFWGPEYSASEIQHVLQEAGYDYKRLADSDLFAAVIAMLRRGLVVGWYQGRSEWGPRALGNRSILADPTHPDMKNIINAKIKRRESFRPFAPSVLAEKVGEYFEQDIASPFMMHVVKFKAEWREKLPAVTHVDGTGRLQSIHREENPRYYDLIRKFSETSGVAILLNTSFNENEPVVESPQQALACFARTEMDALCLGNFLVEKARSHA